MSREKGAFYGATSLECELQGQFILSGLPTASTSLSLRERTGTCPVPTSIPSFHTKKHPLRGAFYGATSLECELQGQFILAGPPVASTSLSLRERTSTCPVPTSIPSFHTKKHPLRGAFYGAESRNRTGTGAKSQQILSLLRLPVPPYPHKTLCHW